MSETRRLNRPPPGVRLCLLSEMADPGARSFSLALEQGHFQEFVVRSGGALYGYVDECPHLGLPLATSPDQYLTPNGAYIECKRHGAVFEPTAGRCIVGPCVNEHLAQWPIRVEAGVLITGADD